MEPRLFPPEYYPFRHRGEKSIEPRANEDRVKGKQRVVTGETTGRKEAIKKKAGDIVKEVTEQLEKAGREKGVAGQLEKAGREKGAIDKKEGKKW